MPVPDIIFLGICGAVTMASVGIATGCAIGIGNVRAQRDALRGKLANYRANEPQRFEAYRKERLRAHLRSIAPIGNKSPVRAAKRAAMRVEG